MDGRMRKLWSAVVVGLTLTPATVAVAQSLSPQPPWRQPTMTAHQGGAGPCGTSNGEGKQCPTASQWPQMIENAKKGIGLPASVTQVRQTAGAIEDGVTVSDLAEPQLIPTVSEASLLKLNDAGTVVSKKREDVLTYAVDQAHAKCFENDPFPSAAKCKTCHPAHYREWSVSPHAYAQLSPIFNAMQSRLNQLLNGTLGDFCIRCHTPVGMAKSEGLFVSNLCRPPSSREGVTCVVCHRINQSWGKGSGRQALVPGTIHSPVYGPLGSDILNEVLANPDDYGVLKTAPNDEIRGRDIHNKSIRFFYLTTSAFCGACHDVFAPNGFRLEDAFSEFKASPAAREKCQSCEDCHMGIIPGVASGFRTEPAAKVGNLYTAPRKRTMHMFAGPDHSIIHPGLFPHNPDAVKEECCTELGEGLATMREWLKYDYEAGWGLEEFEATVKEGEHEFGPWADKSRRLKGREILNDQMKLLGEYTGQRLAILRVGYGLGDIELLKNSRRDGLAFKVGMFNGTDGHGVPTGFDAERVVFLRVIVWNPSGKIVYTSGDLDPNGDIRDAHSFYVHNGLLPLDRDLLSLQTKFITRNIRGGEREQILNVPFSLDPLPYNRPETRPFTFLGRPLGARKQKQNIEPHGWRYGHYHVDAHKVNCAGPYTVQAQIITGMVPVNLVHEISKAGFDYCMSAKEVADRVVSGHLVLREKTVVIHVK